MISQFTRLLRPRAEGTATTVAEAGAERDRTSGHGDGEQPSGSAAGAESRGTFSALRYRNFRLFFFGQLISLTGTWMDITAEGWLVYKLTGSKLLLGVVGVAGSAPLLLFSIWGGWLADHYPKRTVIVLTQSVSMVLAFILSAIVWLGVVRPWHIVLIAFLFGIVLAFDMPSRQSFFIEMTSRDELANAISLNSSIVNGARIVGPAVAGAVMAQSGIAFCFFLNGLSFIAVIAVLLMMRLPAHVRPAQKESAWKQALSGFHYLRGNFRVCVLLSLFAVVGVFGWSYAVAMPAFARDILRVDELRYGILMASCGCGALTGALWLATAGHRLPKNKLAFRGVLLLSVMLILFAVNRNYYLALLLFAGVGLGGILFFALCNTLIQTSVPDHMRGRVMGIWTLVFGAMIPLGNLVAGSLASLVDVPLTLIIGALICAAATLVAMSILRRRDAAEGL